MCWMCNPYCGRCRPPKEKPRSCSQCNKLCFDTERTTCEKCGAELPPRIKPQPAECLYAGVVCANPCGKSTIESEKPVPCAYHTALS